MSFEPIPVRFEDLSGMGWLEPYSYNTMSYDRLRDIRESESRGISTLFGMAIVYGEYKGIRGIVVRKSKPEETFPLEILIARSSFEERYHPFKTDNISTIVHEMFEYPRNSEVGLERNASFYRKNPLHRLFMRVITAGSDKDEYVIGYYSRTDNGPRVGYRVATILPDDFGYYFKQEGLRDITRPTRHGLEDFLILPGGSRGGYEYPDLLVSMHRLSLPHAQQALMQLNLYDSLCRRHYTYEEGTINPNRFLGYLRWDEAHELLHRIDSFMLTLRQHADLIDLLKSRKVYDGNGKRVNQGRLNAILNVLLKRRESGEWLDARFVRPLRLGQLHIRYHRINNDGTLSEVIEPLLEWSRMDFQYRERDFWRDRVATTAQGLPYRVYESDSVYRPPKHGTVALAYVYNGIPTLNCSAKPNLWSPKIGVRQAMVRDTNK